MLQFYRSLYFTRNFFLAIVLLVFMFVLGSMVPFVLGITRVLGLVLVVLMAVELFQLYLKGSGFETGRTVPDKLSNGDDNHIYLKVISRVPYSVRYAIIDEVPVQFQMRDTQFRGTIRGNDAITIKYSIRPTTRGEYHFGNINLYVSSQLHLVQRRFVTSESQTAKVYPSIQQVKRFSLLAMSNNLSDLGLKKVRKLGHSYEFEQIREYVPGDDYRSINWKATGRTSRLMVNQYEDERSQHIYAVINTGRVMKMPFDDLTLLDYSINSALVLLNSAFLKDDHPGLITYDREVGSFLSPSKKKSQINHVLESLYRLETNFYEANYVKLVYAAREKVKKRSLMILYTNFEGMVSLNRELDSLKNLAKYHRLIVVIFKNSALHDLAYEHATTIEGIYTKTIAQKYQYEKQLICKELNQHGIDTILTEPAQLTANVINKYLEIKARNLS